MKDGLTGKFAYPENITRSDCWAGGGATGVCTVKNYV